MSITCYSMRIIVFFFKQKTAYEMRISDWSSDVCSSDLTNDASARGSPFGAAISVAPAINPRVAAIQVNRAAGVTRAVVAPKTGRDLFAGQGAVIDLGADGDAVTRTNAFQFVEFGEAGAATAGGSRAAAHVQLRNALYEARDYARK